MRGANAIQVAQILRRKAQKIQQIAPLATQSAPLTTQSTPPATESTPQTTSPAPLPHAHPAPLSLLKPKPRPIPVDSKPERTSSRKLLPLSKDIKPKPPSPSEIPHDSILVKVTNTYSWASTNNQEGWIEELSVHFTFAEYQHGEIKIKPFVTPKQGRFGTGLLPEVLQFLKDKNIPYTVVDVREPLPELFTDEEKQKPIQIDANTIPGTTLREYQVRAINTILQQHRGIVKCATGGGKSLILAAILQAIGDGVPTVIMMRQVTLVNQLYDTLVRSGITEVGRVTGKFDDPRTITICTIQSAHRIQPILERAEILMVDEVHDFSSKLSQEVFNACPHAYMRLGFSATPFKANNIQKYSIMSCFGPALVDIDASELIKESVLAQCTAHIYPIEYPPVSSKSWHTAETLGIATNDYFHQSVAELVESIPSGRILILVKRIEHGNALHRKLPGSFWISGRDDAETRAKVISQLRTASGKKVVALMSSVGFVGVDVFVHHVINAAGGKQPYLTIQKLGRGLRKANDKDYLDYHDFFFNNNPMLAAHSRKRISTLRSEGHPIQHEGELVEYQPIDEEAQQQENL